MSQVSGKVTALLRNSVEIHVMCVINVIITVLYCAEYPFGQRKSDLYPDKKVS